MVSVARHCSLGSSFETAEYKVIPQSGVVLRNGVDCRRSVSLEKDDFLEDYMHVGIGTFRGLRVEVREVGVIETKMCSHVLKQSPERGLVGSVYFRIVV